MDGSYIKKEVPMQISSKLSFTLKFAWGNWAILEIFSFVVGSRALAFKLAIRDAATSVIWFVLITRCWRYVILWVY